ncbi:MAG: hypothetical protein ACRD8W_24220 [Nitrososphaeraceae archaeon]
MTDNMINLLNLKYYQYLLFLHRKTLTKACIIVFTAVCLFVASGPPGYGSEGEDNTE